MTQVKLCKLEAVPPGELRKFNVGEAEVLVINYYGQYHCLAARCTHAGAPLVEGDLSGEVLICPWHYSNFRISDGSVIRGPAEKSLKVYPATVSGDDLLIEI
jgi:nitrite reductase/ring-hydroxylating ferredoxin subunit